MIDKNLEEANLKGDVLQWAYLIETNLSGADPLGANLLEANLLEAYGLSLDQLSRVKTLYNTKLDKELFIPLKEKFPALFEKPVE